MNNIMPKIGKVFEIDIIIEHVRFRNRVRVRIHDFIGIQVRSPKESRVHVRQSRPMSVRLWYGIHHFTGFDDFYEMRVNVEFQKRYFHADLEKFAGLNFISHLFILQYDSYYQ